MQEAILDPSGFKAILTTECWFHIAERHPEMQPFKHLIVEAIQHPDRVYLGKRDPTRRIYRKRHDAVPGVGNSLDLLVFVDGRGGYVATAHFAAYSVRMLGQQIWPSS